MPDWNERRHWLDYDSAVAMRYHGRRLGFIDLLARLNPALSVFLGGATFASAVSGITPLGMAAGIAVAASGALNLAFGLGDRARLHESLFRRWGQIRTALVHLDDDDEVALRGLEAKRAEIDAESPPQLQALSVLCENEEKIMRRDKSIYQVGWLQRCLANITTLPGWRLVEDKTAT